MAPFITSRNILAKTRLNYHLHRKIVVVDGQISWTGGFNVGDQYLGNLNALEDGAILTVGSREQLVSRCRKFLFAIGMLLSRTKPIG